MQFLILFFQCTRITLLSTTLHNTTLPIQITQTMVMIRDNMSQAIMKTDTCTKQNSRVMTINHPGLLLSHCPQGRDFIINHCKYQKVKSNSHHGNENLML